MLPYSVCLVLIVVCSILKVQVSESMWLVVRHLTSGHSLGHMEDLVDVIFTTHTQKYLDTAEKYHIYQKTEKKPTD